jgi:hypothetical protein
VPVTAPDDVAFERRWRPVQRAGRVLLGLGLIAALAGVFGTGPLANATAQAPRGAFSVDYDRFLRTAQSTELQIAARAGGHGGTVALAQDYLNATQLGGVSPQPDSETARGGRIVLRYDGGLPDQVELQVTPRVIGIHRATLWVDGRPVSFRQVTWP